MADQDRLNELADQIDVVAGSVINPHSRRLTQIAAELRGTKAEPTPNELRQAERASARQAEAEAREAERVAAEQATAAGLPVNG